MTLQTDLPQFDPGVVLAALAVFVAAYVVARVGAAALSALGERVPRHRIAISIFVPILRFLAYGTAVYLVVRPLLQLTTTQLLAVSGILAAAIGFGLKDLLAGVVGGLVIVSERPYQVGDKVTIDEDYGEVTGIGLRATTLTTPDDTAVRVPNAALFDSNVANANAGSPSMLVVVDVTVAADADLEAATDVMRDALVTSRYVRVDADHPVEVLVADRTGYRRVRGKAYVADLRDEFPFSSDVTERTLAAFAERGIESPEIPAGAFEARE